MLRPWFLDMEEWHIRKALRHLSRQRVKTVLQPGNIWLIENAAADNEDTDTALKTCYMRGWVEPIEHAIPKGSLNPDGSLPPHGPVFNKGFGPIYRITDSGWSVINRSQQWVLITVFLAFLALIVG